LVAERIMREADTNTTRRYAIALAVAVRALGARRVLLHRAEHEGSCVRDARLV